VTREHHGRIADNGPDDQTHVFERQNTGVEQVRGDRKIVVSKERGRDFLGNCLKRPWKRGKRGNCVLEARTSGEGSQKKMEGGRGGSKPGLSGKQSITSPKKVQSPR